MSSSRNESVSELLRMAIAAFNEQIAVLQERRAQLSKMLKFKLERIDIAAFAPVKRKELSDEGRAKISAAQKARWTKEREGKAEPTQTAAPQPEKPRAKPVRVKPPAKPKVKETPPPELVKPKVKLIKAASPEAKRSLAEMKKQAERHEALIAPKPEAPSVKLVKTPAPEIVKSSAENTPAPKAAVSKEAPAPPPKVEESAASPAPVIDLNTPAGIVEQMARAGARFRITRGGSLIVGNLGTLPPALQRLFLEHPDPHLLTAAARRHLADAAPPKAMIQRKG